MKILHYYIQFLYKKVYFVSKENTVEIEAEGDRKFLSDDLSIIGTRTEKTCVQCIWYAMVAFLL